jgi:hypothetical protein
LRRFPREVTDPDLGVLKFKDRAWCGQILARGVPILFRSGPRSLDPDLRIAGVQAVRELTEMETRARDFLETVARDKPWPALRLTGVEVLRPAPAWVRHHVAVEKPAAADTILGGEPIVSLEFQVSGDRNVADVILLKGVPVGWDYH